MLRDFSMRVCTCVGFLKGREALHRALDRPGSWVVTNRMKFNKSKCQILYMDGGILVLCTNGGWDAGEHHRERDLGVCADGKLNLSQQGALAAKRANLVLCRICEVEIRRKCKHKEESRHLSGRLSEPAQPCFCLPWLSRRSARFIRCSVGSRSFIFVLETTA